jgi:lysophospholipase L1-like esterase
MKNKIVSSLLPPLLVLLLLESLARVAATIRSDFQSSPDRWFEFSRTIGWAPAPGFRGSMECGVSRAFDANGFRSADTEQVNDSTKRKVIFLGDSTTMGFCVETESSFVELLDASLTDASAINLGVNGYTSYQGANVLAEIGPLLEPDLVVASFNFNDRRYILEDSQADSAGAFETTLQRQRAARVLEASYVVRGIQLLLRAAGLVPDPEVRAPVDLQTVRPRVTLADYKKNLAEIVRWARENGSEVLFVILGDNPVKTAHLNSGITHLRAGELDAAQEELWIARRDDWFSDLARLYQAELYRSTGKPDAADRVATAVPYWSLHGGRPIVLDTIYNDAMREVATEYHVEIVDARAVLEGYPGVFIDNAHFDARGHKIVADLLVGPIENLLAARDQ